MVKVRVGPSHAGQGALSGALNSLDALSAFAFDS
jgi:hypothetical protein